MKYEIYIDGIVIFIGIWNVCLLYAVWRFLSCTATRKRIFLAAFSGALVMGVCMVLPIGSLYMRLFVGALAAGFLMLRIGFMFIPIRNYMKVTGVCVVCSFFAGSLFLRIESMWGEKKRLLLWLVPMLFPAGGFLMRKLQAGRDTPLNSDPQDRTPTISVKIVCGEEVLTADAIVDTGNHLWDPLYGQPVNLVSRRLADRLEDAWCKNSFHVVPYQSVGCKKGLLNAYRVPEIVLQTEIEDRHCRLPVIAVTDQGIDENFAYQMILHPLMLWKEDNSCCSMWQR